MKTVNRVHLETSTDEGDFEWWLVDSHGCVVVRGRIFEDGSEGEVARHRYEMAQRISELEAALADTQPPDR